MMKMTVEYYLSFSYEATMFFFRLPIALQRISNRLAYRAQKEVEVHCIDSIQAVSRRINRCEKREELEDHQRTETCHGIGRASQLL